LARGPSKTAPKQKDAGRLNHRQRIAWLRLIRSENVGPATFRALVNEFGGAEAAIDALPLLSRRGGRSDIRLCTEAEAEAELEAADRLGASLVAVGEPGYPPALAQVDAPPPLLYAKGRLDLANIPIVAIVGARNGSPVGQTDRHRARSRRFRHRFGFCPRHRHGGTHGSLGARHHRRAGRRHRHRLSARE
jgi:hypothetical protein